MKNRNKIWIYFAFFALAYLLHTSSLIYSADLKIGIKPSGSKSVNYEDIINPGESKTVPYKLINLSDSDLKVSLELAGVKGSYEDQADYDISQKYKILDYIKLQTEELTLKKSEKVDINLLLSVPEGSDPGEYLGGLLVKDFDTGEVLGESKVNLLVNGDLQRKLDATVSISVENDIPKAKVKIANLGNTKVEGIRVDYVLKNLKFQKFISSERSFLFTSPIVILPGSTEEIEHDLDIQLDPVGSYEVSGSLNYGGLEPIMFKELFDYNSKTKLAIFGTIFSVVFVIFSLAIFFFARWFYRKRKQVKSLNRKWDTVVSSLIDGNYNSSSSAVSRIHAEDMDLLVTSIREEVRKTFRDEISTLNYGYNNLSLKKKKPSKIPRSVHRVSSII